MKTFRAVLTGFAMLSATIVMSACIGSAATDTQNLLTVHADVNEDGYDLSGFGERFPEVFSKDNTVTVTADSYQSHDINIQLTRYVSPYLSGDVTEDRKVSLEDVILGCKYMTEYGSVTLTEVGLRNADCDVNGLLNAADIRQMLSYLQGSLSAEDFFVESSLEYHVADIYIRNIESFRGAFAEGTFPQKGSLQFAWAEDVAAETNALLLINADYVECRGTGIIYRNGVHYRDLAYGKDVCVLYNNGEMDVLTTAEYFALSEEELSEIWQTSNFYKGLVKDGVKVTSGLTGSISTEAHPRSGIGYYEPGHYCFVQVDGRQAGYSAGFTMAQFADLFEELGVQEAYNLDGGSSSSLVFNGSLYNTPSPVHVGGTDHGRQTSDFFYICEPSQITVDTAALAWGNNPPQT